MQKWKNPAQKKKMLNSSQLQYQLPAVCLCVQEVRDSRRHQEQRIVEVDSGVKQDYEFKLAQALQVC